MARLAWLAVPGGLSMLALAKPMRDTEQNGMDIFGTERNEFFGTDFFPERNGTDFSERIFFAERNGTDFSERIFIWNGTERIFSERLFVRNGTERNGTVHPCLKL
jgi:hypothetical protein